MTPPTQKMLAVLGTLGWLVACRGAAGPPDLHARTEVQFAAARLVQPAEESAAGETLDLAPLLVIEAGAMDDAVPSIVYFHRSATEIAGESFDQRSYLWRHPEPAAGAAEVQGVRITLGLDGFPAIFEILTDSTGARPVFVSTLLEQSAAAEFGAPAPGRTFAVEQPVASAPDTVVAGLLDPGPVPLGPFVYLLHEPHDVATLICRCSPSQVDDILNLAQYRLEPLADPAALGPGVAAWLRPAEPGALERLLRLPSVAF